VSKVLLVDGNSLTYRAFFALPTDLATASGQITNAVYGFTSMLINVIRDHQPDAIVVAFDLPEPTFRHERAPSYKGQREAAPDILRQQMGLVREVLGALCVPTVEAPGFEADDIIATMATAVRDAGNDALIVTGDRDAYQLVEDPHVAVLYNRRGVSDYALYDEAGIAERTGVTPALYPQYAALRGDPSDNLPGVPKVGEKTAAKLINTYGGLDGIFQHLDEQTPALRKNLAEHEARVRLNHEVMVLRRDVPLEIDPNDLKWGDVDTAEIARVFTFLEFSSLYDRLNEVLQGRLPAVEGAGPISAEVTLGSDPAAIAAALATLRGGDPVALGAAFEDGRAGMAVVTDVETAEVLWIPADLFDNETVHSAVAGLLGAGGARCHAHDVKPLMKALTKVGIDIDGLDIDSAIAAYLIDADARHDLPELTLRYLRRELTDDDPASDGQLDLGDDRVDIAEVAGRRAVAVALLAPVLAEQLDQRGLRRLYDEIERPLVGVLARMEAVGVGVDIVELTALRDRLVGECERLRQAVWAEAGREFNVNSTKQLSEVLFDELGLTPLKKTSTGAPSTDAQTLEKMRDHHPIVAHLLDYREVEKLRSTYGQGLLDYVGDDGRIHATFNQTVARTGRLSSEDPNLHNIPVRSEQGRAFRNVFVPAPGTRFLVADYNQIELRVIAHLAEDPGLIDAFESRQDIHEATASRIFGVEPGAVTIEQRSKAKMVSYGLAYGMESYGLGQRLNIPTEEAALILDAYFVAFPRVKAYMEDVVAETRRRGYTETVFGRRRPIPELSSGNYRVRQAAERQAMNAPIQGLAADIFKVALVRIDAALRDGGYASRLVLQVHDEVILEVPPDEQEPVTDLTVDLMRTAADLRVPLEVNVSYGDTWAK
jgi:DNA polymerase-1